MPTTLPPRAPERRARDAPLVIMFVIAFFAACFAIEMIDPAPMDLAAAWIASP